jgi:hypothetical protein
VRLKNIPVQWQVYWTLEPSHRLCFRIGEIVWLCNESYAGCKWVLSQVLCVIYMKLVLPCHSREKYPSKITHFVYFSTVIHFQLRSVKTATQFPLHCPVSSSSWLRQYFSVLIMELITGFDQTSCFTKGLNNTTYFVTKLCSSNWSLNYQMLCPSDDSVFLRCSNLNTYNQTFFSSSKMILSVMLLCANITRYTFLRINLR